MKFFSRLWTWIKRDSLRANIFATLFVTAAVAGAVAAPAFIDSVVPEGEPSVIDEIQDSEIWTTEPKVYPNAAQILNHEGRLIKGQTEAGRAVQVRTAQELVEDADLLSDQPVVVVGRVAGIEHHERVGSKAQSEVALFGDDRQSRVVLVGTSPPREFPPPLVPRTHRELVPRPGSMRRFKPDYEYGVFVAMIAAIGTTTSSSGGPTRTVYVLAASGALGTDPRGFSSEFDIAVRQALAEL